MYLIYWKNKVGQAVAALCDHLSISYEMVDDSDGVTDFSSYEAIIPSPWVPGTHPIYATGKIISELDLAYEFLPKDFEIVSITGTDGKSTTTWMMYNILEKEYSVKKPIFLSGNFDIPFSATVLDILKKWLKKGIIVLEISSFMAHELQKFQSDYSIFTNFKPDHLNWHTDLQEYLNAKMHVMTHTKKRAIINREVLDFAREKWLELELPENTRVFESIQANEAATLKDWTNGEDIAVSGRRKYTLSETHFSGMHNAMNLLSVALVGNEMGICSKRTKRYFADITGLPHRLEKIWEKRGIIFVEDSKSTSSQSLEAALGSYGETKNLLLIVGGSDKWDTFVHLASKFRDRAKAMVCIGATKSQFSDIAKQENITFLETDSLSDAVHWLFAKWEKGDVLMLSPGCASFWLFKDYLDRANQFREAIKNLPD